MDTPIPTIARTDDEWEALAAEVIARSGVPGEDPAPLAMALKNSAAREAALADTYWLDLTAQAAGPNMRPGIPNPSDTTEEA